MMELHFLQLFVEPDTVTNITYLVFPGITLLLLKILILKIICPSVKKLMSYDQLIAGVLDGSQIFLQSLDKENAPSFDVAVIYSL